MTADELILEVGKTLEGAGPPPNVGGRALIVARECADGIAIIAAPREAMIELFLELGEPENARALARPTKPGAIRLLAFAADGSIAYRDLTWVPLSPGGSA